MGNFSWRLVRKVETDGGPHLLGLAGGPQVSVEHQVIARIEPPCQAFRLHVRSAAWLPKQEMPVIGFGQRAIDHDVHPGETLALGAISWRRAERARSTYRFA